MIDEKDIMFLLPNDKLQCCFKFLIIIFKYNKTNKKLFYVSLVIKITF